MPIVLEYDYYQATLTISVHTPRPDAAPSTVFVAGKLHNDYVANVRAVLREYKGGIETHLPQSQGLPLYGIRKVVPEGTARSVDQDFMLEVTTLRFGLEIAIYPATWAAGETIALGVERNIEKAVKDLFTAQSIPFAVIPGDGDQLGESFVDISCDLGPATNQGDVPAA